MDLRVRYIIYLTWLWAQLGLAYRAFETATDPKFDLSPWLAFLFSYQVRLIVGAVFIATVSVIIITAAKAPLVFSVGIAGPLAFIFGREPALKNLLTIMDKKI